MLFRDPSRVEVVQNINNKTLICQHERFMYPLKFVSEFLNSADESDEM